MIRRCLVLEDNEHRHPMFKFFKVPLNSFNILTDCKDVIAKDTPSQQSPSFLSGKFPKPYSTIDSFGSQIKAELHLDGLISDKNPRPHSPGVKRGKLDRSFWKQSDGAQGLKPDICISHYFGRFNLLVNTPPHIRSLVVHYLRFKMTQTFRSLSLEKYW